MPRARTTHAEARDHDFLLIDCVAGLGQVEQCIHCLLVFRAAPIALHRIRPNDYGAEFRERRTNEDLDYIPTGASRICSSRIYTAVFAIGRPIGTL